MCKHQNCVIYEFFDAQDEIVVRDGIIQSISKIDLFPSGKFFVKCWDCGMQRTYCSNRPKWLEDYLDKAPSSLTSG
jgi:hypothetical protein